MGKFEDAEKDLADEMRREFDELEKLRKESDDLYKVARELEQQSVDLWEKGKQKQAVARLRQAQQKRDQADRKREANHDKIVRLIGEVEGKQKAWEILKKHLPR